MIGELLVLVLRNEAHQRPHVGHFRQSAQLFGQVGGVREIALEDFDRIGAGVGIAHQIEEGRDQFDITRAQVERVEVEAQAREQRQAQNDGRQGHADDPVAPPVEKAVERRERGPADRRRLAARLEHGEQRRKQGYGGRERDDHAGSGDQAEFGQTHICGRQERVEGGRDRGRREQKRRRHAARGGLESLAEIALAMPLGAVADAELDAEVDAKANEQHGEGDGDEVQRSDHPDPDGGGQAQADREVDEDSQDDADLFQRQSQHQENDEDRHDAIDSGAVGDRGELLVRKGDRSGEAHRDAPVGRQAELGDRRADRLGRLASGLEIVEIEDGLDIDEPPKLRRLGRAPGEQPAPGEGGALSLRHQIQGVGDGGDCRPQIFERGFLQAHPLDRLRQRAKDAAQRRVRGERPEEGLRLDQVGGVAPHFFHGLKQDAVAGEELAAVGPADRADHVGPGP